MGERGLHEAAAVLGKAVMACGAGVSAESGIPTFRGTGGIWDRIDPVEVGTPGGLMRTLEAMGILKAVITQITDNLHQEAWSSDAIEVHGNMFRMKCLACGRVRRFERKPVIRDVNFKGPHQGAFCRTGWIFS